MKMVYLNGQFLAPNGVLESSSNDYYFKKGRLYFEFPLKMRDHIAVVRTFLGITWSRRYYRIDDYMRVPADTPLQLCRGGKVIAEQLPEPEEKKLETSDDVYPVS